MSRTFIIAALTAVLSFGLMALIPSEQKTTSVMPMSIKSEMTEIRL